jgi:hypothetical protein
MEHYDAPQDRWYSESISLPLTVHYGCCGAVQPQHLQQLWHQHSRALLNFVQASLATFNGLIFQHSSIFLVS